jgi:hypothetical protein
MDSITMVKLLIAPFSYDIWIARKADQWANYAAGARYYFYNIFILSLIVISWILLQAGLTCRWNNLFSGIIGITIMNLIVFFALWDLISWCLNYLKKQTTPEHWEEYKIINKIQTDKLNSQQITENELEFYNIFNLELKYTAIKFFKKFLFAAFIIILAFGLMHCFAARIHPNFSKQAYDNLPNEYDVIYFVYYSTIIFTNSGLGNFYPKLHDTFYISYAITGIEVFIAFIFTILFLILLISCIYTTLSVKPAYFSAILRSKEKQPLKISKDIDVYVNSSTFLSKRHRSKYRNKFVIKRSKRKKFH